MCHASRDGRTDRRPGQNTCSPPASLSTPLAPPHSPPLPLVTLTIRTSSFSFSSSSSSSRRRPASMRVVVVGVVAVVVLAVAVVGTEVRLTRAKKYRLCTARDVSMLVAELCSGTIGSPMRGGLHRGAGGNAGIMIRSQPIAIRGRRRENDGPVFESLPLWENVNNQKYSRDELDRLNGSPDLIPAWDMQDTNSYEDLLAEPGWRVEARPDTFLSALVRLSRGGERRPGSPLAPGLTHTARDKRQTLSKLRARCCREGCDEAELYTFCV